MSTREGEGCGTDRPGKTLSSERRNVKSSETGKIKGLGGLELTIKVNNFNSGGVRGREKN